MTVRLEPLFTLSLDWRDELNWHCSLLVWQQDACIFTIIDYLQHVLDLIKGPLHLAAATGSNSYSLQNVLPLALRLENYDRSRRAGEFETETFECGICLYTHKGRRCSRLQTCGHVCVVTSHLTIPTRM